MKNQTIGVEIEMTGITRNMAAKIVARVLNGTIYETGNHTYDTREITAPDGRVWKVMRDGSILPKKKMNGSIVAASDLHRVEFVTPILKYNDIELLQTIIRALRKAGAMPDSSCGIHIHVGAKDMNAKQITNLIKTVNAHDDLIYKALNIGDRADRWCKKTNQRFLKELEEKKPQTIAEIETLWYDGRSRAHVHYDFSRYQGLNLHALFSKGTVEFRLFNSTLHAGKVKAYIQFCLAMVAKARTDKRCSSKPIVTDNPKYTFRCWLLKLELSGDEFKTCRLHMMAKLEGNGSYRHGA